LKFPFGLHCINTLTSHIQFLFIIATSLQIVVRT
jgi:divalent metal cation (Fe/Co/Zn/Cd) transporter